MAVGSQTSLQGPSDRSSGNGKKGNGKTGLLAGLDRLIDRTQRTLILATCVTLVTTFVTVAITCVIVSQASEDNSQIMFPELCIDCGQLTRDIPTQPEVSGFSRRLEMGSEMCCAETPEQISALLEAACLSIYQLSATSNCASSSDYTSLFPTEHERTSGRPDPEPRANDLPVSAHKRLLPVYDNESLLKEPRYIVDSHDHFAANFNTIFDDPATEHAHGVEVLPTAFRINYTGLYFVYCSVHIEPVFNKTLTTQAWTQYVYRRRPNTSAKQGTLLQSAYTAEGESTDHEESLFIAGNFHLDKGDELQVYLIPIGVFHYKPESSFLGVILMNSGPLKQ